MLQLCSFCGAKAFYQREDIDRKEPHVYKCWIHGARCHELICTYRTGGILWDVWITTRRPPHGLGGPLSPQVAIGLGQARHVVVVISGAFGNLLRRREVTGHSELGVGTRMISRQIGCLERDMGVVWENRAPHNPVRSWSTREAIFVCGS